MRALFVFIFVFTGKNVPGIPNQNRSIYRSAVPTKRIVISHGIQNTHCEQYEFVIEYVLSNISLCFGDACQYVESEYLALDQRAKSNIPNFL